MAETEAKPASQVQVLEKIHIPPFARENPALWFKQLEFAFELARIRLHDTKFMHAITRLDTSTLATAEDLLSLPREEDRYELLKQRFLSLYGQSTEEKLRKLLHGQSLHGQKPSLILQKLRQLADGQAGDAVLRALFFEQLPENMRSVLAPHSLLDLTTLAQSADKIFEVSQPSSEVNSVVVDKPPSKKENNSSFNMDILKKALREILREDRRSRSVAKGSSRGRSLSRKQYDSRNRSRTANRNSDKKNALCYYHAKFDVNAYKCKKPCSWETSSKKGSEN